VYMSSHGDSLMLCSSPPRLQRLVVCTQYRFGKYNMVVATISGLQIMWEKNEIQSSSWPLPGGNNDPSHTDR
jgi:hypothetical protein